MSDAQLEFGEETESAASWSWPATVFAGGRVHALTVTLSFQDYDLWSRGRVPPVRTAEACLHWLLEREPAAELPDPFDCARTRRRHPAVDAELPAALGIRFGG